MATPNSGGIPIKAAMAALLAVLNSPCCSWTPLSRDDFLIMKKLLAADFDVAAAQQGIVYIDEVDKITKKVKVFNRPC